MRLIWLGKQYLNQKDTPDVDLTVKVEDDGLSKSLGEMATQKTAGQRGRKDTSWDNLERIKMGILCEAVALVLSGELDKLEKKGEG